MFPFKHTILLTFEQFRIALNCKYVGFWNQHASYNDLFLTVFTSCLCKTNTLQFLLRCLWLVSKSYQHRKRSVMINNRGVLFLRCSSQSATSSLASQVPSSLHLTSSHLQLPRNRIRNHFAQMLCGPILIILLGLTTASLSKLILIMGFHEIWPISPLFLWNLKYCTEWENCHFRERRIQFSLNFR